MSTHSQKGGNAKLICVLKLLSQAGITGIRNDYPPGRWEGHLHLIQRRTGAYTNCSNTSTYTLSLSLVPSANNVSKTKEHALKRNRMERSHLQFRGLCRKRIERVRETWRRTTSRRDVLRKSSELLEEIERIACLMYLQLQPSFSCLAFIHLYVWLSHQWAKLVYFLLSQHSVTI